MAVIRRLKRLYWKIDPCPASLYNAVGVSLARFLLFKRKGYMMRLFYRRNGLNRVITLTGMAMLAVSAWGIDNAAAQQAPAPVTITADKVSHEGATKVTKASGDVVITYRDKTVTGAEGWFNHESGDGQLSGDVRLTDPTADITGRDVTFNSFSELGTLTEAKGDFNKLYYFTGEKIERVSADQYLITNGSCSSCPFPDQSWRFEADDIDVTREGYAFIKGLRVYAKDTPVFYLPYFIAPAKTRRATGLLQPGIGHSTKDGVTVANSFFWAMAENMDATLSHEYLGKKGNKLGLEYRYILSESTYGTFNGTYLHETDPDKPADRDLWKVIYDHRQTLPWGVANVIHLDRVSENDLNQEYSDNVADTSRRYTDSYATWQKTWGARSLTLLARGRETARSSTREEINTLPQLSFVNQSQTFLGSPVYYALQSSATAYRLKSVSGGATSLFDVDRFDVYPVLSAPVSVAPWLSLTPEAGYRYTTYSRGADEADGGFDRQYYTLALRAVGPKFFRIFDTASAATPKIKHLITPTVTWNYLPGYDYDGDDRRRVRVVDGLDRSAPNNTITYALSNQLLFKEVVSPEESRAVKRFDFTVSQSYDLNEASRTEKPEAEKRPFSPLTFDVTTLLYDWLLFNYHTRYNVYDSIWTESNLAFGFRYESAFHFALDRRWKHPSLAWDTVYAELNLPGNVTASYAVIYDEEKSQVNDSLLTFTQQRGCWSYSLSWQSRKVATADAAELEDESKVFFTLTLLGIGDAIGSRPPPVAGRKL